MGDSDNTPQGPIGSDETPEIIAALERALFDDATHPDQQSVTSINPEVSQGTQYPDPENLSDTELIEALKKIFLEKIAAKKAKLESDQARNPNLQAGVLLEVLNSILQKRGSPLIENLSPRHIITDLGGLGEPFTNPPLEQAYQILCQITDLPPYIKYIPQSLAYVISGFIAGVLDDPIDSAKRTRASVTYHHLIEALTIIISIENMKDAGKAQIPDYLSLYRTIYQCYNSGDGISPYQGSEKQ